MSRETKNTISEIILLSIGPSDSVDTWSGVPFFLKQSLLSRDILVHPIDLEPPKWIKVFFNCVVLKIWGFFVSREGLSIYRSHFFVQYSSRLLKKALACYPNTDIVLGLSYLSVFSKIGVPVVLLSDWPYRYVVNRKQIKESCYLKYWNKREFENIESASLVVSLFPSCSKYINNALNKNQAVYLGVNVINAFDTDVTPHTSTNILHRTNRIVFIGREHYIQGATDLINATKDLKDLLPDIQVDIIGLERDQFNIESIDESFIHFHGYLSKNNDEEMHRYYEILKNASLFVNSTERWSGYTSMIEAMYYYTPVVVYPCAEYIDEFGPNISFGVYCDSSDKLGRCIESVLNSPDYEKICLNAHHIVENYTWDNFTHSLLECMSQLIHEENNG